MWRYRDNRLWSHGVIYMLGLAFRGSKNNLDDIA